MEEPILHSIHDCSELPHIDSIKLDAHCLDAIQAQYTLTKWIGFGQDGITAMLERKNAKLVVKITFLDEFSEEETRIACSLNALAKFTPLFTQTFGWLACGEIPKLWMDSLRDKQKEWKFFKRIRENPTDPLLFMFIHYAESSFEKMFLHIVNRYRVVLFLLLHAIYIGRREVGLRHYDLHAGNIMFEHAIGPNMQGVELTITFGNGYEATVNTFSVPKIIDYGRAVTDQHMKINSLHRLHESDITTLEETFMIRLKGDAKEIAAVVPEYEAFRALTRSKEWKAARDNWNDSDHVSLEALLLHPYFNVPEITRTQVKRARVERCLVCGQNDPTWVVRQECSPKKLFCGERCFERMSAILSFIK
jgi:hypothetical protein